MIPTPESTFLVPGIAGSASGFMAGYALRKVLKFVVLGLGLISLALAYLELQRLINVNWPNVEHQATTLLEHIMNKAYLLTRHIGTELGAGAAGFSIGLLIGLAKG